jgi:hypothetical protein
MPAEVAEGGGFSQEITEITEVEPGKKFSVSSVCSCEKPSTPSACSCSNTRLRGDAQKIFEQEEAEVAEGGRIFHRR